jgi:hypothetical protein
MIATSLLPIDVLRPPTAPPAARVSLKPARDHTGMVNGAWWPRSRDLTVELPPLIAVLDRAWSRINRATVNVRMWPEIPRRVQTGTHIVRVGWFDAEQDPHDICLLATYIGRWDLVVVPPEFSPARAARLMATAADVHNKQTASVLVAESALSLADISGSKRTEPVVIPPHTDAPDPLPAAAWETDGGRVLSPWTPPLSTLHSQG